MDDDVKMMACVRRPPLETGGESAPAGQNKKDRDETSLRDPPISFIFSSFMFQPHSFIRWSLATKNPNARSQQKARPIDKAALTRVRCRTRSVFALAGRQHQLLLLIEVQSESWSDKILAEVPHTNRKPCSNTIVKVPLR